MSSPSGLDTRRADPSDLSRSEWAQVARFIPAPTPGGRPAQSDRPAIVHALLYVARTGGPWRARPHDLPPGTIVAGSFRTWKTDGTRDRLRAELGGDLRGAAGRPRPPAAARGDSPSVRTTENGGSAAPTAERRSPGGSGPSSGTRSA